MGLSNRGGLSGYRPPRQLFCRYLGLHNLVKNFLELVSLQGVYARKNWAKKVIAVFFVSFHFVEEYIV